MARFQTETVSHINHYSAILTGQEALLPLALFVHSLGQGSVLEGEWTLELENLEILNAPLTGRSWAGS